MNRSSPFTRALALASAFVLATTVAVLAQPQIPPDPGEPGLGEPTPSAKALVGQAIFLDTSLSRPEGQSCVSCHDPGSGFVDARSVLDPLLRPTSEGAVAGRFGPRNTLTLAYADHGPALFYDAATGAYIGGRYRDGRAPTAMEQAKAPFLDRAEMNNSGPHSVVLAVRKSAYARQFEAIYGPGVWHDTARAFDAIAECLVEFQSLRDLNRFDSRYDRFLAGDATQLTPDERMGKILFEGTGGCAACHPNSLQPDGARPLFTTYRYYNLGVPRNPRNPFYDTPRSVNHDGAAYVDLGLGGALGLASEDGKFKVPTLRNVALTGPYMHNGVFTTLEEAVQFHNTRDVDARWGPPEVPANVSTGPLRARAPVGLEGEPTLPPGDDDGGGTGRRLGNLGLTQTEVGQIVAFLRTLSDTSPGPP